MSNTRVTPRSDPHTEAIRAYVERSFLKRFTLDGRDITDQDVLAALAALESERDEAVALAEVRRQSRNLAYRRALAAEARVTQLEEPGVNLIAWIDGRGPAPFSTIDHNFRGKVDRLRSALGVVADGGGGQ